MKKVIFCVFGCVIAIGIAVCSFKFLRPASCYAKNNDVLRIHIRANSNSDADQTVKFKVKESIVEYLTPFVANSTSAAQAKNVISEHLEDIEQQANAVLLQNGFCYTSKAQIRTEKFPTRSYGEFTLEAGTYEALIVELGSGTGDNWWCVMFPPLCFVDGKQTGENAIKYKSKLVELVQKYLTNR